MSKPEQPIVFGDHEDTETDVPVSDLLKNLSEVLKSGTVSEGFSLEPGDDQERHTQDYPETAS